MDAASVLASVGGNRRLLREMVRLCLEEDAPRLFAQLHAAAAQRDFAGIEEAAHAFKGLVGGFDAEAASVTADQIVASAQAQSGEFLDPQIATFEREFAQLAAVLRSLE
jgi:HPt (histidine-containing phosphotransfer) domain-containing protein